MRIGTLDIETSPHQMYGWRVWQENIAPGQIIKPTYMMTWAWKWIDEGVTKTIYRTFRDDDFLSKLHDLMNEADMIIGYNHDKFDLRHISREFLEVGYGPPRPCATVDMLKVVKKRFNFPHNRLDYVASVVLGEKKLETGGFDLWPAFMEGEEKAQKIMKRYNIKDVILTERLYRKLKPWISNHPHTGGSDVFINDVGHTYTCPACQSDRTVKTRSRFTRCFAIRVVGCLNCGGWTDGKRTKL